MVKYFVAFDTYLICYSFNRLLSFYARILREGAKTLVLCYNGFEGPMQYAFSSDELEKLKEAYDSKDGVLFKSLLFGDTREGIEVHFDRADLGIDSYGNHVVIEYVGNELSVMDFMTGGNYEIKGTGLAYNYWEGDKNLKEKFNYPIKCNSMLSTVTSFKVIASTDGSKYDKIRLKIGMSGVDANDTYWFNGKLVELGERTLPLNKYIFVDKAIIKNIDDIKITDLCLRNSALLSTNLQIQNFFDSTVLKTKGCRWDIEYCVFNHFNILTDSILEINYLANTVLSEVENSKIKINCSVYRLGLDKAIIGSEFVFNCRVDKGAFLRPEGIHAGITNSAFIFNQDIDMNELYAILQISRFGNTTSNRVEVTQEIYNLAKGQTWYTIDMDNVLRVVEENRDDKVLCNI